ncbi:ParB family protein [Luteimonas sp. XNQY3]|nr:ParB family protein [Luteimonas sp. XNQY3]MCD9008069.1 ParB family protein [Luteimonas sp. XNQY3]
MADLSTQDMAAKLMNDGFARRGPAADALSAPIVDTPMVVTLDELHAYELDPRITRNPLYEDIKASIRERGLDAPPPITRRPGADHYIIRNGGNTRLAILRELWSETKQERFFRIACLFRPWPERGEIVALTGHLAENELRGGLTFIERALGVEKARELYEQESGKPLSQSELARRLKADGYPVPQPHISRMQEAVQFLLPAIPNILYGGLGRHQIEQLTALRRAGARIWEARSQSHSVHGDLASLFQDVLAGFDEIPGSFSVQRAQDELVGQMADLFGVEYDTLAFDITDSEGRWEQLNRAPAMAPAVASIPPRSPAPDAASAVPTKGPSTGGGDAADADRTPSTDPSPKETAPNTEDDAQSADRKQAGLLEQHIVSPAATTERLQSIQRLIADRTGESAPDFERNVLQSIPVQAGGLYPISDVWHIDQRLDDTQHLRTHIAQFAQEIAAEVGLDDVVVTDDDGIGFCCRLDQRPPAARAAGAVLALLHALSAPRQPTGGAQAHIGASHLAGDLADLLLGPASPAYGSSIRLTDSALVKLFRLVRLARRLLESEADATGDDRVSSGP